MEKLLLILNSPPFDICCFMNKYYGMTMSTQNVFVVHLYWNGADKSAVSCQAKYGKK